MAPLLLLLRTSGLCLHTQRTPAAARHRSCDGGGGCYAGCWKQSAAAGSAAEADPNRTPPAAAAAPGSSYAGPLSLVTRVDQTAAHQAGYHTASLALRPGVTRSPRPAHPASTACGRAQAGAAPTALAGSAPRWWAGPAPKWRSRDKMRTKLRVVCTPQHQQTGMPSTQFHASGGDSKRLS
jgi:hypothetical protein